MIIHLEHRQVFLYQSERALLQELVERQIGDVQCAVERVDLRLRALERGCGFRGTLCVSLCDARIVVVSAVAGNGFEAAAGAINAAATALRVRLARSDASGDTQETRESSGQAA